MLLGLLQMRERVFTERGVELEEKKEREKHLWSELSGVCVCVCVCV
jgi:hypothetical protein